MQPQPFHAPRSALLTAALIPAALILAAGPAAAQHSRASTFTSGTEGWTHVGATSLTAVMTGGNPGGYLEIDNSEGPVTFIFAPPAMLGDLRAFDGGTLSFDGNMLGIGGNPWTSAGLDYGHVRITSPAGVRTVDLLPAPGQPVFGAWTTYSVALDVATWGGTQPTWTSILSNVTEIRLSVEAMFGLEVQGIDNFTLTTRVDAPWSEPWNGNGSNPAILRDVSASAPAPTPASNAPAIGKNWVALLDCNPAGTLGGPALVTIAFGPRPVPLNTIYGQVLIPLGAPSRTLSLALPASRLALFGPVLIPNNLALVGTEYTVQGACPSTPRPYLGNALYEVVGN